MCIRDSIKSVSKEIESTVREVNSLSPEEQRAALMKMAPRMLERETKKQEELPNLPGAKRGRVVTRFAPSPTGPLSLPHLLRAAMLSYLYAKRYGGRFILRFEDTDPRNIEPKSYDWIKEDLERSGIKPDRVIRESDNMELYYKHAESLIGKGRLYVCHCSAESFRALKSKKQECGCRNQLGTEDWKKMLSGGFGEGRVSVRLKTSMRDPNPALRDPVMLRIVTTSHPLKKKKYRVWPLYNFASVIDDHEEGITHIFRGKEHEHNTAIQRVLYDALGWKQPVVINFGMIYLPGKKTHTRDIREWIKQGRVSGWDDPRLPTVRALLRRGFQPEAFKRCAIGCSLSKTDIRFTWDTLEGANRKIIDPEANRYMVVTDPVKLSLKDLPQIRFAEESLHPDFPKQGKKRMPVDVRSIHITREDYNKLKGKTFRLKALGNFRLTGKSASYMGNEIERQMQKIQWVSSPSIGVSIITPERTVQALGEQAMKKLKPGDLIQMERIGFGRVDSVSKSTVKVYFAHK